jgi:predicted RND superfamily exporter protein
MQTSIKIEKFFAKNASILKQYEWIESKLGNLVPMELVLRFDNSNELSILERMELVQQVQKSIEQLPAVGSTTSAATFAPKLSGSAVMRGATKSKLESNREAFVNAGYLADAGNEELWRISLRVQSNNDLDYGAFVSTIREQVEPVLGKEQAAGIHGISAVYTGMVPVVYKAQRSLLDGLLFGFSTDLLLIVVAITVTMRHWSAGLLICITSIFPAALVFGTMSWLGIVVDIGSVLTPSVALGVTVDDVVHFLLWYKRGIERGMNRGRAVMLAYEGCAKPMYQSWGVIGLGLSVFALSPFIPTLRFGALMIALLTAGLIGNLFLMPALLTGPLGAIFQRRILKAQAKRAQAMSEADVVPFEPQPQPVLVAMSEVRPRASRRSVKA